MRCLSSPSRAFVILHRLFNGVIYIKFPYRSHITETLFQLNIRDIVKIYLESSI